MGKKAKVLIVEDERDIAELIALHLTREGHEISIVENGEDAMKRLNETPFDLLVLDWMLPGAPGLEVCKRIRGSGLAFVNRNIPILMVTARAHATDIVVGLEMGADDYVTKPFEIPVLVARVKALLRRGTVEEGAETEQKFRVGELYVDEATYKVTVAKEELSLTTSEFKLLAALLRSQGRVMTRQSLIDMVQGEGVNVIDRTIDTHIFGLRKKLGKCADLVETIRGVGYRIKMDS